MSKTNETRQTSIRLSRGLFRSSCIQPLSEDADYLYIGEKKIVKSLLLCQRLLSSQRLELWHLRDSELVSLTLKFEEPRCCSDWLVRLSEVLGDNKARKPLLVFVNPYGGNRTGSLVWKYRVEPLFKHANRKFERIYTKHGNHITQLCAKLDLDEYSGVVVVGGDGSVAEAVNGLYRHPDVRARSFPVGLIPAGSSNALAKARGLGDPKVAAFHIIKGNLRLMDLVKVRSDNFEASEGANFEASEGGLYSLCAVSLGFLSEVNSMAKDAIWRKVFGPARYEICGLRRILFGGSIAKYQAAVRFRRRGQSEWETAEKDEGSWDVISPELWSRGERQNKVAGEGLVLVTHLTTFRLLRFFSKFSSNQVHEALGDKHTIYKDIEAVEISTTGNTRNLPFSIDGELHAFASLRLELVKDAVRLFGGLANAEDDVSTFAITSDKERNIHGSSA